jgi:hypothetical protein
VEISSGSLIQVDSASLRDAAARFEHIAARLSGAGSRAMEAWFAIAPPYDGTAAWDVAARAGTASISAGGLARDLRYAADVYDIVESQVRLSFIGFEPPGADRARDARMLEERIAALDARSPGAREEAGVRLQQWERDVLPQDGYVAGLLGVALASRLGPEGGAGVASAVLAGVPLSMVLETVVSGIVQQRRDAARRGDPISPSSERVRVSATSPVAASAPRGVAEVVRRIPSPRSSTDPAARVRIERYAFADGSRRFGVYITGTREWPLVPGPEPFDLPANLALHSGAGAASSDAVFAALEQAGARRGDVIDIAAHSQGVMAGNVVAASGEYTVGSMMSFGAPQVVGLSDDTLALQLAYDEDPVAALAGGGTPGAAGSPESLRVGDDFDGDEADTLDGGAHGIERIVGLAEDFDASQDPRVQAYRDHFDALGTATSVEVIEVAAERVLP